MTNVEAAIKGIKSLVEVRRKYGDMQTMKDEIECLEMGVKELTAISELSKSLKAVNCYDMDEKVLIGFNMAVAIFNKCFGEIGALKNEQSEQNVGMCQQNVGEMSEKQTDGDLISRTELLNKIWRKEYGKDYDGVNMLNIPNIDIIEQMPSAKKTAEWIMPQQDDGMSDPIYYQVRCSKCGFDLDPQVWHEELHQYGADKYCPKCGHRMKGVE